METEGKNGEKWGEKGKNGKNGNEWKNGEKKWEKWKKEWEKMAHLQTPTHGRPPPTGDPN